MNDEYISKQSVIDYLNDYLHSIGECGADSLLFDRGQRRALINSIQDISAVKAANVQPMNQWISVKDRLPDKDGNYLCYLECGEVCQSIFDLTTALDGEEFPFGEWVGEYDSNTLGFVDNHWEEHDAITHWMPLPEPPKEGDTE